MAFWQIFLLFSFISAISLLWPFFIRWNSHRKALRQDHRSELSDAVQQDRKEELERTHALGEIDADELRSLHKDLERTHSLEINSSKPVAAIATGKKSRWFLATASVLVPLFSILLYGQLGSKQDWFITEFARSLTVSHNFEEAPRRELIKEIQQSLKSKPENGEMWYLLGSLASQVGDYEESVRAFRHLKTLYPEAAAIHAELAQSLFLRAGNTVTPEVRENTNIALGLDASLPTALGLSGIDAFQSGQYEAAITLWERAVKQLDPQSPASQVLSQGIARAQLALEASGGAKNASSSQSSNTGPSIKVSVTFGEGIDSIAGDETLFVYARAWQGSKMPLAVQKLSASVLPTEITLDRSMAMWEGTDITSVPQLEVVARVSKSGGATPVSGDWIASAGPVILSDKPEKVKLTITEQIP